MSGLVNFVCSKPSLKAALFCLSSLILSGCVHVRSVSLTEIPKDRSRVITAEASKFMFLGIAFDSDYVEEVRDELKNKCRDGIVSGILTKDESVNYFILFSTRRVIAQGFCVKG